jgi:hypothetical protein
VTDCYGHDGHDVFSSSAPCVTVSLLRISFHESETEVTFIVLTVHE